MIYPEDKEKLFKSLRIIKNSDAYPSFKEFMEMNIKRNWQQIYDTTDERVTNRLIGETKSISALLQEMEDSPKNELAYANGNTHSAISIPL